MRSNGFQITGNELQAMVNERIVGSKAAIPQTDRCLTRQEVFNSVYCYAGDSPSGSFLPYSNWEIGGVLYAGVSPNLTCNYEYINPIQATGTVVFEMNQLGTPYLNCDLFAQVNGSPLRLDPASGLDGMFFGGPQVSPNMASAVKIGNQITVQANFGLDNAESPGNFGWNGNGFGILEIYRNNVLVSTQSTSYRVASSTANATQLTYSFIVENSVNYYIKAYPYEDTRFRATVNYSTSYCNACNNPIGSIAVIGNASTFCTSTSFYANGFADLTANNYYLSYGGYTTYITTHGTAEVTTPVLYGIICEACIGTAAIWTYQYQNCASCVTRNIYKDTNICSATYGQYKINPDGTAQVAQPTNTGACNTAQTWTDNGTVICIGCTSVTVYKNTNPCSSNHNFYRYTNPTTSATITQESDPSGTACSSTADWVFQHYNCLSCVTRSVKRNMNPCSSTYLKYTVNNGDSVISTAPTDTGICADCCGQSTTQVWSQTVNVRCLNCVSQVEQKQTNACATGYDTLRWVNGGSNCNTTATWVVLFGTYECVGCNQYFVEVDNNSCSATHTNRRRGGLRLENTTNCGDCCAQSTTADWTIAFGSYSCLGCDKYYNEVDLNSCSPTSGDVRRSSLLSESNSTYCCIPPDPPTTICYDYNVNDYGYVYYTDCQGYQYNQYMNPWDSFCAQTVSSGNVSANGECGGDQF